MPEEGNPVAEIVRAAMAGKGGDASADTRTQLSAREKMKLYRTTLFVVAGLYLVTKYLDSPRSVTSSVGDVLMPAGAPWIAALALSIPIVFLVGVFGLAAFALWQVFKTGRTAIQRALPPTPPTPPAA